MSASPLWRVAIARSAGRWCTCSSPSARRARSPASRPIPRRCPCGALRSSAPAPWAGGIAMSFANAGIPVAVLELSASGARTRARAAAQELRRFREPWQPERGSAPSGRWRLISGVTDYAELGRRRHHHRGGVRGPEGEAGGVRAPRWRGRPGRHSRHQHLHARHRSPSPRAPRARSRWWARTSSVPPTS